MTSSGEVNAGLSGPVGGGGWSKWASDTSGAVKDSAALRGHDLDTASDKSYGPYKHWEGGREREREHQGVM